MLNNNTPKMIQFILLSISEDNMRFNYNRNITEGLKENKKRLNKSAFYNFLYENRFILQEQA